MRASIATRRLARASAVNRASSAAWAEMAPVERKLSLRSLRRRASSRSASTLARSAAATARWASSCRVSN